MKHQPCKNLFFGLGLFSLAMLLGCGGGGDTPELAPVEGNVTMDGKPVSGVQVIFMSEGEGRNATGTTDADGHYTLRYSGTNLGAPPGEYKVAIVAGEGDAPVYPEGVDPDKLSEAERQKYMPKSTAIPSKYGTGTELSATVTDDSNEIDFQLNST